ncbi:MAG: 30S ribosomal protein S16 [Limisphaerales bacterium]
MKRVGTKNAPVFRIVVADGRSPRDGKFIEEIGVYQPLKPGDNFSLKLEPRPILDQQRRATERHRRQLHQEARQGGSGGGLI